MKITQLLPLLTLHGRTVMDEQREALFCNWTCTGFTARFTGSWLKARITVMGDEVPSLPGTPPNPTYYPFLGVVADGSDQLYGSQECREPDRWYTLWEGENGEHTVRTVKLSENSRGKLGFLELETDGEFLQAEPNRKPVMEVVGDSITCAFGNEAPDNDMTFRTGEENGWMSYAAIAARELGYEWQMVCESGISAVQPSHPVFPMHAMCEIYPYTDELYAARTGKEPTAWDFAAHHCDIVVLNLGTNDANPIRFYQNLDDVDNMAMHFQKEYRRFLADVRRLNGPDTLIVCALGSMDYYLYEHLTAAVREYQAETGDRNVMTLKFVGINMVTEGYGAAGHPSLKTHIRMGHELAHRLRRHLEQH